MARLPDWVKYEGRFSKNGKCFWNFSVRYIPLKSFIKILVKRVRWRIWLYPRVFKECLDKIGIVFRDE